MITSFTGKLPEYEQEEGSKDTVAVTAYDDYTCFQVIGPRGGVKIHRHWPGVCGTALAKALGLVGT